jgi:hypothetical protein
MIDRSSPTVNANGARVESSRRSTLYHARACACRACVRRDRRAFDDIMLDSFAPIMLRVFSIRRPL